MLSFDSPPGNELPGYYLDFPAGNRNSVNKLIVVSVLISGIPL